MTNLFTLPTHVGVFNQNPLKTERFNVPSFFYKGLRGFLIFLDTIPDTKNPFSDTK